MWSRFDTCPALRRMTSRSSTATPLLTNASPLQWDEFVLSLAQRLPKFLGFLQPLHPFRDTHWSCSGLPLYLPGLCHSTMTLEQCDRFLWQLVHTTNDRRKVIRLFLAAAFCMFLHSSHESSCAWVLVLESYTVCLVWKSINPQSAQWRAGVAEDKHSLKAAELQLKHLKAKPHTLGMTDHFLQAMPPCGGNNVGNGFPPVT